MCRGEPNGHNVFTLMKLIASLAMQSAVLQLTADTRRTVDISVLTFGLQAIRAADVF